MSFPSISPACNASARQPPVTSPLNLTTFCSVCYLVDCLKFCLLSVRLFPVHSDTWLTGLCSACYMHGKLLSVWSATYKTVSSSLCFLMFCLLVSRLLPRLPVSSSACYLLYKNASCLFDWLQDDSVCYLIDSFLVDLFCWHDEE